MKHILLLFVLMHISYQVNAQKLTALTLINIENSEYLEASKVFSQGINVLVFVDATCPYIAAYQERLLALSKQVKQLGYRLIVVNPHQLNLPDKNNLIFMKEQSKRYSWQGSYFADPEQKLVRLLKATKLPEVFIVNHNIGELTILYSGAIDDNPQEQSMVANAYVKNALNNIKQGEVINNKKEKAIGCRIMKF